MGQVTDIVIKELTDVIQDSTEILKASLIYSAALEICSTRYKYQSSTDIISEAIELTKQALNRFKI